MDLSKEGWREDEKKEIQRSGDLSRADEIETKEIDQSPEEIDKKGHLSKSRRDFHEGRLIKRRT